MEGHRENFRHVQGRPLFDVVHPAFPLPTTALSTLQGALNDGFGKVVVSRAWVGVFSTRKESLHDALSHFRMGHIRNNTSGIISAWSVCLHPVQQESPFAPPSSRRTGAATGTYLNINL